MLWIKPFVLKLKDFEKHGWVCSLAYLIPTQPTTTTIIVLLGVQDFLKILCPNEDQAQVEQSENNEGNTYVSSSVNIVKNYSYCLTTIILFTLISRTPDKEEECTHTLKCTPSNWMSSSSTKKAKVNTDQCLGKTASETSK